MTKYEKNGYTIEVPDNAQPESLGTVTYPSGHTALIRTMPGAIKETFDLAVACYTFDRIYQTKIAAQNYRESHNEDYKRGDFSEDSVFSWWEKNVDQDEYNQLTREDSALIYQELVKFRE